MGDTTFSHCELFYEHLRYPPKSVFTTHYLQHYYKPDGSATTHLYNSDGFYLIYPNGKFLSSGRFGRAIRQRSNTFQNALFLHPQDLFWTLKTQFNKELSETDEYYRIKSGNIHLWVRKSDSLVERLLIYEETQSGVYYDDYRYFYQKFNQTAFSSDSLYTLENFTNHSNPIPTLKDTVNWESGSSMPAWTLPTSTGDSLSLASLTGKVVLLDWWYEGCKPCLEAMPHLQELQDKYGSQGLQVVGINPVNSISANTQPFLQNRGIRYPALYSNETDPYLPEKYDVEGIYPSMYILDQEGQLVRKFKGYTSLNLVLIENEIKRLLTE